MKKNPIIYFNVDIMSGHFSMTILGTPKFVLFDLRFSDEISQLILFDCALLQRIKR